MVLSLRDAKGNEIAYGDDFRFDPDPVFCWRFRRTATTWLKCGIRSTAAARISCIASASERLPSSRPHFRWAAAGRAADRLVRGWNLPDGKLKLDTSSADAAFGSARMSGRLAPSNDVPYAIDTLPETNETEPNETPRARRPVSLRGQRPDRQAGRCRCLSVSRDGRTYQLVVEVQGRRLRSPLDSVVHVADENGKVLGWNDDAMEKNGTLHLGDGLLTHHADSRVRVTLPAAGPVYLRIADTQLHGGPEFAYRLRICEVRPDFELRVTPSVINVPTSGHVPMRVHVPRNDGFDGEIRSNLKTRHPASSIRREDPGRRCQHARSP